MLKNVLADPLIVSYLQNLYGSAHQVQSFHDRVRSYMIAKAIEGLIENISLKEISIHLGKYEWADTGGLLSNYGPNMI